MQGLSAGLTFSDRFTLRRRLGVGGMGEVWLADDLELAEPVALKLLATDFAAKSDCVDLLRQECSRARALVHPNIVRVYDFHAADGRYFISMQYIDGNTLIASRGAPFQTIVHQALMVCDALAYAHRADVIHRDVKAGNVLVDRNGVCYLTDFGLAAAVSPGASGGVIPTGGGTLPSMSPQQLAGEPAAVSDDVYALGALLYELLSGMPLFHPDVTPERIRATPPAPLSTDGTDQALPEALTKLVLAMLSKSAGLRPAGIGAVRSVLEEVNADFPRPVGAAAASAEAGTIRPVSRRTDAPASAAPVPAAPLRRRADTATRTLSPRVVYGGLAALLLAAIAVIFMLPRAVDERRATVGPAAAPPAKPEVAPEPSPLELNVRRQIADEVLGELLVADDRLQARGVEAWGGADWAEARDHAAAGDEAYQDRRYDEAVSRYRQALTIMKVLEPRAPAVLATALREGLGALEAGDQPRAVEQFELALAIDAANQEARGGLQRATRLDEVLALMRRAGDLEAAGDLAAAAGAYEKVLAIDGQWTAAREGLQRSRAGVARLGYEQRMAAGFGALSRREFEPARREFEAALAVKPGDPDARAALRQVDVEARHAEVIRLQAKARIAEAGENWAQAVSDYDAILAIDPAVTSVQQKRARARERQRLGESLESMIARSDEFNDDRIAREAHRLLEQARAVPSPGDTLQAQMQRLDELLRIAAVPVPVVFRSDNQTEVVIFKVGSLGMFESRTLELKPGRYVAVGSRAGYRDVRRSFQVLPDGSREPIVLSCEEPI